MSTRLRMVELVAGSAADIAAVEQVMGEAFDPQFGEAWTRGQCLGILGMPGVWLTLARVDGAVVGFSLARAIVDEAELLLLATSRLHQRQGIGAALLRGMLADARGRGVVRVHLEVRAGNGAIELYRAHGFEKLGERRSYYRGRSGEVFDAHSYGATLA
jgi:ribosomal-protein-alanine N-acetyltransferase